MDSLTDTDEPYHHRPSSCLYVIVVGENRIKVGQSCEPGRRIAEHRRMAEAHGAKHGRQWTSYPCSPIDRLEDELITFCAQRATRRFGLEAAAWLGVSEQRIYELIRCGELWVVGGQRQLRVPVMALRRWRLQATVPNNRDMPGTSGGSKILSGCRSAW